MIGGQPPTSNHPQQPDRNAFEMSPPAAPAPGPGQRGSRGRCLVTDCGRRLAVIQHLVQGRDEEQLSEHLHICAEQEYPRLPTSNTVTSR